MERRWLSAKVAEMLIESRITRLEGPPAPEMKGAAAFIIVLVTILSINYYLV